MMAFISARFVEFTSTNTVSGISPMNIPSAWVLSILTNASVSLCSSPSSEQSTFVTEHTYSTACSAVNKFDVGEVEESLVPAPAVAIEIKPKTNPNTLFICNPFIVPYQSCES